MFTFFMILWPIAIIALVWWRIHLYRRDKPTGKILAKHFGKALLEFIGINLIFIVLMAITVPKDSSDDDEAEDSHPKTHKVDKKKKAAEKKAEEAKKKAAEKKAEEAKKKAAEKKKAKQIIAHNKKLHIVELKKALKKMPSQSEGLIDEAKLDDEEESITITLSDDALDATDAQLKALTRAAWKMGVAVVRKNAPYPSGTLDASEPSVYVEDSTGNELAETSGWTGEFKYKGE